MDKFRYFITGVIVLVVALVYVFLVKVQKPGLDMRISLEKDTFLYGEDFTVKYTIENLSDKVDSVLHFSNPFLSCAALIIESESGVNYGGDASHRLPDVFPSYVWKYGKIQPGGKLTSQEDVYNYRGYDGGAFFKRFHYGEYIFRGLCEKDSGNYIFSNTITFHIVYPKGKDLEAYKEYRDFEYLLNKPRKGALTDETCVLLIDKAIEVLYKYPKSVYAGKLLCLSNHYRESRKYKYDESYLKDIEFFIENNPDSYYLKQLLVLAAAYNGIFSETLAGKEKAIAYLNSLKIKLKNDKLNKLIDDDIARYQKLRVK